MIEKEDMGRAPYYDFGNRIFLREYDGEDASKILKSEVDIMPQIQAQTTSEHEHTSVTFTFFERPEVTPPAWGDLNSQLSQLARDNSIDPPGGGCKNGGRVFADFKAFDADELSTLIEILSTTDRCDSGEPFLSQSMAEELTYELQQRAEYAQKKIRDGDRRAFER